MNRSTGLLISAVLSVLAVSSAIGPGAQASEFHCSANPCTVTTRADGTEKNSHHVLIIRQGAASTSITCRGVAAISTGNPNTTAGVRVGAIQYSGCQMAGGIVSIGMNGCEYVFWATETMDISCPPASSIRFGLTETGCQISIGPQTGLSKVSYSTIGTSPSREVTVSPNIGNIAATVNGSCSGLGLAAGSAIGEYTTGNTVATGETAGGVMADAWFA